MGISFRKSFKIAPGIRMNLSTKGIGLSGGVKGTRVSIGPRGVHTYGGVGPIRFQKKLNKKDKSLDLVTEDSETSNPMYTLAKPNNWLAWVTFFLCWPTLGLLVPVWIYTLIKGPKKVMAFRKWHKIKHEIQDYEKDKKVNEFQMLFDDYSSDFFRLRLAFALFESEKYQDSLEHFIYLLKKQPTPQFSAFCGECCLNLERWADALSFFEFCDEFEEYEEYLHIIKLKAEVYMHMQEYDKALECVDSGIRKKGLNIVEEKRKLKLTRAKIHLAMGDKEVAIKETEKILKEAPNFEEGSLFLEVLNNKAS